MIDRCPTCKRKHKRSNPANARYWLVLHVIAEKVSVPNPSDPEQKIFYPAEVWHEYFKARYLGCQEIKLPNAKVIQIPNSTADLPKDVFADYAFKVEHWGMEHDAYLEELPS